jgi:predicted small lipoprotein YifL
MIFRSILWMAMALAATACGLKGPLYLPDQGKQDASGRTSEEQQKKERSTNPSGPQPPAIPTDTVPSTTPPPQGN